MLALLCLFAGCATLGSGSRGQRCFVEAKAATRSAEKSSSATVVAARLDPNLSNRLVPVRLQSSSSEESAELVSIDSFGTSDSTLSTRETLDPSDFELGQPSKKHDRGSVWERAVGDQANFYSGQSLVELGLVFGAGAVIANTSADNQLHKHFQSSVRGASSDDWFQFLHANKELGNGLYSVPFYGAVWIAGEYLDGPSDFETVGQWGERSARGFLVGVPPMLLMQNITGGSRPNENTEGSEWHSFRDNNGVSGHAFMSSLPFITAAKMTDNPWMKTFWYASSTIGPLSRMNDNAHYPSQIGMGWAMAFVAASAVQQTDTGRRAWTLAPLSTPSSSGLALQYQW